MTRGRDGRGWWWIAPPLIGVAAYLGFEATLNFIAPEDEKARVAGPRVPPAPAAAPEGAQAVAAPAVDLLPALPAPSATMAPERAAAAVAQPRGGAKRELPRESLTEADRRALDAVVERATRNGRNE